MILSSFKVDVSDPVSKEPTTTEVFVSADAPHLLKSFRNALKNQGTLIIHPEYVKHFELPSDEVKWEAVLALVEYDEGKTESGTNREMKIAPHVTRDMCELKGFSPMNVTPARQVCHHKTADSILFGIEHCGFPKEWKTTAKCFQIISDWYELANSRGRIHSLTKKNFDAMIDRLQTGRDFICTMKLHPNQGQRYKPLQRGMILSFSSNSQLSRRLLWDEDFKFFRLGMAGNDPVENLHSQIRGHQLLPTCLLYKRFVKAISLTQLWSPLGKGRSYEDYTPETFLTDLKSVKKLAEEQEEEYIADISHLISLDFQPGDFAEACSLAYLAGVILNRTICTASSCKTCQNAYISCVDDEEQDEANQLILYKELDTGKLVRPTVLANSMFKIAESVFKEERGKVKKNKGNILNILTTTAVQVIKEKLEGLPTCHLYLIIFRFIRARLFFWSELDNGRLQTDQSAMIENESFASKSTRAHILTTQKTRK